MASDGAQPQLRRIKYWVSSADSVHIHSSPSRRMSTVRDTSFATTRAQPYSQRRPTPGAVVGPSSSIPSYLGSVPASNSRPVLPSLSSAIPNSHSEQHDMLSSSRTQPMRSDAFSPSFPTTFYNGHSSMANPNQPYSYAPLDPFESRHNSSTPPQPYRHSPGPAASFESHRRGPQVSIPGSFPRDDMLNYYPPSYPANFALTSGPPDTASAHSPPYPASYGTTFHTGPHHGQSYQPPMPPPIDTRGHPQNSHHSHYTADAHQHAHRTGHPPELSVHPPQRGEAHMVSPYARTHNNTSTSPQEPSPVEFPTMKKKRRRADANQLKVLNEVYARTAFPTTEERQDLARRLDMSARSVQIWFQNKRQSSRSRTNAAANPPMMHHPYMSGSSSSAGLSHLPIPGQGHSGAEMSVSPSAHGGSYTVQPSGSGSHRSYRAQSPPNPPPLESLRRARSPEGSSRLRAPAGRP